VNAPDLTTQEQQHLRGALQFLRRRCGGWAPVAKALRFKDTTLSAIGTGRKPVSPTLAVRIARFVKMGVDDVLAGRYPAPGTCPYCGHRPDEAAQ
jgi:hypothetical protein